MLPKKCYFANFLRDLFPVRYLYSSSLQDIMFLSIIIVENLHCRYDFALNRWTKESSLPRKIPLNGSCGFVAMNEELYVLTTLVQCQNTSDQQRVSKKRLTIEIQIYDPRKKRWRFLTTNPPFNRLIDFKAAVTCTIQL